MTRDNRHTQRDRKNEGQKRDAASSTGRFNEGNKSPRFNSSPATNTHIVMDRYRLNDLYERSSV